MNIHFYQILRLILRQISHVPHPCREVIKQVSMKLCRAGGPHDKGLIIGGVMACIRVHVLFSKVLCIDRGVFRSGKQNWVLFTVGGFRRYRRVFGNGIAKLSNPKPKL